MKKKKKDLAKNYNKALERIKSLDLFYDLRQQSVSFYGNDETPEVIRILLDAERYRWNNQIGVRAEIHVRRTHKFSEEEWLYVLSLCLLHIGMNHIIQKDQTVAGYTTATIAATQFLEALKIGRRPLAIAKLSPGEFSSNEDANLKRFQQNGVPKHVFDLGLLALNKQPWTHTVKDKEILDEVKRTQTAAFAKGLRRAANAAVVGEKVQGSVASLDSKYARAKSWFLAKYPLLSALAASFTIIADKEVCDRESIKIAAISGSTKEIYFNPNFQMTIEELRFVMAHEFLHIGLRHDVRGQGRDAYLWNVACDYVVNLWLRQMGVGDMPEESLFDPQLDGLSAEEVYDKIASDLRIQRKLKKSRTFRGIGQVDILPAESPRWWRSSEGVSLDQFYRNCLYNGLELQLAGSRGLIPAGLAEEIRSLAHKPIPWDVKLCQWMDDWILPIEKRRTYARVSRRQSATPDIPRPSYYVPEERRKSHTFAVVVDSSGSMSRRELGLAIGAIAAYAQSRDVLVVRLIYCDAKPYDEGYVPVDDLLYTAKVKGRGGTELQPALNLLATDASFPKTGPVLIVTDGMCDALRVPRPHAYLLCGPKKLPFRTKAPVFLMED